MAAKTRRSSTRLLEKEVKKEEVEEVSDEEEDDDLPPPILERETNCEESTDSDSFGKEAENEMSRTPPQKTEKAESEDVDDEQKGTDLLQALSHVFSAGGDPFQDPFPKHPTVGRPRKNVESPIDAAQLKSGPGRLKQTFPFPKSMLLNKMASGRPLVSASQPSTSSSSSSTRRQAAFPARPSARGPYGPPPPLPSALRLGIGSPVVGPARLLENRKRPSILLGEKEKDPKRSLLVAYNGGRAGENFRKVPPTSTGSSGSSGASTSSVDAVSMLREQSPVQIQVTAGADRDSRASPGASEVFDVAQMQKDAIGNVTKMASNHNVLLGSMVINGLNNLQTRSPSDYQNFSSDLFALFSKYRIH